MSEVITKILGQVDLVIFQTRIVTELRDTGEGVRTGSRQEKVLQSCFDPKILRPLGRMKQEASRICRLYGSKVETLNAWAVPSDRTPELLEQLKLIAEKWAQAAAELADSIYQKVEDWAAENPAEADSIRDLAPTRDDVLASTRFIYTSFKLNAADVQDEGCLEVDLGSLAGQTMHEISMCLRDASLDKSSGQQYTKSVKDVLARVGAKAKSMAFLSDRLQEVSDVIEDTLSMLPTSGLILGAPAVLIKTLVDQLLNPGKVMAQGLSKLEVQPDAPEPATPSAAVVELVGNNQGEMSHDALIW